MKKILIIALVLMTGVMAQAQNRKVVSAYNYLRKNKLDKALENIKPAIEHAKTKDDAKTWFYRGNIYLSIHTSPLEIYRNLSDNALETAFESYTKATELDTRNKYTEDIASRIQTISEQFYNQGVTNYSDGEYEKAIYGFKRSAEIKESMGLIDTLAVYNAGLCGELAAKMDIALKMYNKAREIGYQKPALYTSITRLYAQKGDTAAALTNIAEAKKIFPDNFDVIIAETNIFLAQGDSEKALKNLNVAVKKDTTNPTIWFAVGANYDKLMSNEKDEALKATYLEKAVEAYNNALELKPEYFEPAYNLGALFVNKAAEMLTRANALPLSATDEYNKLKDDANKTLAAALPYLEKAHSINASDVNTLVSLKEIYTRLKQYDKLKEINAKIQENQN
ncbi:MAG: tetratricopeptide repeat protein [Bacteroidota bacterium]|nr:tetratricopeptide repeat protein [Bacteroidota bacterium]